MPNDELIDRLNHAATTAANDDFSAPGSLERKRHNERFNAMAEAAEELARIYSAPTYEQGVAAGLEMAAKVAEDHRKECPQSQPWGVACAAIASAIRALADQHKPAEEPMP